jgi:hypothetical protein
MVLRLVDDVKASVREAGAGTLRSLRGLSLRLMDAAQTPAAGEMEVYTPCRSGGGTQSMLEDGAGSRKGGSAGVVALSSCSQDHGSCSLSAKRACLCC